MTTVLTETLHSITCAHLVQVIVQVERHAQVAALAELHQEHRLLPHQRGTVELRTAQAASQGQTQCWRLLKPGDAPLAGKFMQRVSKGKVTVHNMVIGCLDRNGAYLDDVAVVRDALQDANLLRMWPCLRSAVDRAHHV